MCQTESAPHFRELEIMKDMDGITTAIGKGTRQRASSSRRNSNPTRGAMNCILQLPTPPRPYTPKTGLPLK